MKSLFALLVIMFVFTSTSMANSSGIVVNKIESIVIENTSGHTKIALKVDVTNNGPAVRPLIQIQALDNNGFELSTAQLSGNFAPNETKSLTDSRYIKNEIYQKIEKWVVKEIM